MADRTAPEAKTAALRSVPFLVLLALTTVSVLGAIHYIFYWTPNEATMGIVQKIFYFHVPAAYAMYLGATACFIGSSGYLANGSRTMDALGRAGAECAVVFGLMVLTSGPLWAARAWGVYWTWDTRLTTSLLSFLLYVAYAVLRAFAGGGDGERKFAAVLGVLGAATLPVIHLSVRKWGGTHPEVITGKGGGLNHPNMKVALLVSFVAFPLLTLALLWVRVAQELARLRLEDAEEKALAQGFMEE